MWISDEWKDYGVLDTANGDKLEKFGDYLFIRPDPQIIWPKKIDSAMWSKANAKYLRSRKGGGEWNFLKGKLPEKWTISYKDLKFVIKPTGFKHMGLFPEQAANWDFITERIKKENRKIKVLNLFGYTGGATVAALKAGASVCHVDASKGIMAWCRENVELNGLAGDRIRYIVDDAAKFVAREIKRGNKYDAVIMDPPSYGRGPGGEVWTLEDKIYSLTELLCDVLSDNPAFFIVNSYTTGLAPSVIGNILKMTVGDKFGGSVEAGELALPVGDSGYVLPCGSTARWTAGND